MNRYWVKYGIIYLNIKDICIVIVFDEGLKLKS